MVVRMSVRNEVAVAAAVGAARGADDYGDVSDDEGYGKRRAAVRETKPQVSGDQHRIQFGQFQIAQGAGGHDR